MKRQSDEHARNARIAEDALRWMNGRGMRDLVLGEISVATAAVRRRRRSLGFSIAGAVVVLALLVPIVRTGLRDRAESAAATAVVTVAPSRVLSDGSVVEFDRDASVEEIFGSEVRRVRLVAGQAHFAVKPDSSRPFVVEARGVEVRAVGTAFSVKAAGAGVDVVVTHGRVSVEPRDEAPRLVDAGERAQAAPAVPVAIGAVSREQMAELLAWRSPRIEFSRTPIEEAVALINRRSESVGAATRLRCAPGDERLRRIRISGYLSADNIEGFVALLEGSFGVAAERHPGAVIELRAER